MLSDITVEHKHLYCLFELSIGLSKERFASFDISGESDLREGLVEFFEQHHLLTNIVIVGLFEVIVFNSLTAKV